MELGTAVTTVKGEAISVADVILHLKAKGTFRTAIYEIIEQRVIEMDCVMTAILQNWG